MKSALKSSLSLDEGEPMTASPSTKSVGFGRLEFREYPIIMGDNPSVSDGVPLALDWDHFNVYDVEVDSYEIAANKAFTCTAGSRKCPRFDVTQRAHMLMTQGYSMRDIVECTLEVLQIKEGRSESVRNRKWDGLNNFMEVTKRAMKRKKSSRRFNNQQQPLSLEAPPGSSVMATPPMRRPSRRRSLELTSSSSSSSPHEQEVDTIMHKIRSKAPRRRSTLMVTESMMNPTWASSA